jgi:hypothetical protein
MKEKGQESGKKDPYRKVHGAVESKLFGFVSPPFQGKFSAEGIQNSSVRVTLRLPREPSNDREFDRRV